MTAVHHKLHASRPHSLAICTYINQSRLASYYRSHSVLIRPLLNMSSTSITYDLSKLEPPLRALCEQWLEESNESLEALSDRLRSLPREVFEPPTHTIPEEPVKRYDKYTVKTVQTYKPTHPGLRVNFNSNAGGDLVADKVSTTG